MADLDAPWTFLLPHLNRAICSTKFLGLPVIHLACSWLGSGFRSCANHRKTTFRDDLQLNVEGAGSHRSFTRSHVTGGRFTINEFESEVQASGKK